MKADATRRFGIVLTGLALLLPAAASAQVATVPFAQVSQWVRPGDRVYLRVGDGREYDGQLMELSESAVRVQLIEGTRDFDPREIQSIAKREHDSLLNGTLTGLGIGAGLGMLGGVGVCSDGESCGWIAAGGLLYGGIGAGIGLLVDALTPGRKLVVYQARSVGPRTSVRLSSLISPHRQGIAVAISY